MRARYLQSADRSDKQLHRQFLFVAECIQCWDSVDGGVLAVARPKHESRPFAWGLNSIRTLFEQVRMTQQNERSGLRLAAPDHDFYIALSQIADKHRGAFSDYLFREEPAQNAFRTIYMQLLVTLQDGMPQADVFRIDVPRLASDLNLSVAGLFELAEREAERPGCQFGVLIRVAREEAAKAVAAAREAASADVAAFEKELAELEQELAARERMLHGQ